ncbi:hypothetical protein SPHINGO8AM_60097 [Sphingomonas sp. 8AM]|nr:hypothetical protein SPHINGO8AM_60097 [Sphingomonas sp. 8AM]
MVGTTLRVARIADGEHAGRWSLWSDSEQRWAGVLYVTERHATEALRHLTGKVAG